MGLFWDYPARPSPVLVQSFREALLTPPDASLIDADAETRAAAATSTADTAKLNAARLVVSLGIVAVLVIGGVITDANHLVASSTALYTLATTAFGIVVGVLSAEKPKS
jgi:hypothetical protein